MAWFRATGGGGSSGNYSLDQGQTTTSSVASVTLEEGKHYLFFTGCHSGTFTNADIQASTTSYFEIISGIGVAVAIIKATSNNVTYTGSYVHTEFYVEIDTLKDGVETDEVDFVNKSLSWERATNITTEAGKYYLLADTVNGDSSSLSGCDVIAEETMTASGTALNIKIRLVKATSTSISIGSGNALYYREVALVKFV